jgi:hypothetical protein
VTYNAVIFSLGFAYSRGYVNASYVVSRIEKRKKLFTDKTLNNQLQI